MPPDIEKYRKHVDRFDLSEDQKVELIHTVWRFMESFADRAFGLDSVHLISDCRSVKVARSPKKLIPSKMISLRNAFDSNCIKNKSSKK